MKLPFFQKRKIEQGVFFGLFLKESEAIALVLKMHNSQLTLIDEEKFTYSNGWNNLAEDIDQVILKLEQKVNITIKDTIFFLYSNLIDEKTKEVKKEFFAKIKELVKKLDLKALGYIECYEAVKYILEKKEEIPLSTILIELDQANLSLFIYKRGQIVFVRTITFTGNLIDDLLTCFQEIKGKFVLPSRIVLYNSKDLEAEATDIVTYRWSEDLFIQLPRVEVLKEYEIVQGLIGVFGEQFVKNLKSDKLMTGGTKSKDQVLGFVIGEDIGEEQAKDLQAHPTSPFFPYFQRVIHGTKSAFNKGRLFFKGQSHKWLLLVGVGLFFIALLLNELFVHTASLTVYLPYTSIAKETTIQTPITNKNKDDFSILTTTQSVNLSDSKSTTGKKEIGEKAKGIVTIHNFDDNERNFPKGSLLQTSQLQFVLDQDTKVASSSVVTLNGGLVKQPGKTKAAITAENIGPQGNIGAGKQFSIEDLPSSIYFAMNEESFTGGTKSEIRTVSKQDLDQLKTSLAEKAKSENLDRLEGQNNQMKLLSTLTDIKLSDLQYDRELGEEADKVGIRAKADAILFYYDDRKLLDHLGSLLSSQIKKGFVLEKNKLSYSLKKVEKKEEVIRIVLTVKGNAVTNVSPVQVIQVVKGTPVKNLESKLKQEFKAEGFRLDVRPNILLLNSWMPFFTKNITVKTSSL
ncbi:hypothetical protein A3F60_03195 [Candidatus Roizmanbacteria bacterium RIFCSPHIGHO2_12_FULL_39_8]|nr:MAG: hypothetical protein A3F60_03195 [Candidatus Roizmanbacteria bacterium RIFCSPHIGHO2_12_FULL_39_8]